MVEPKDGESFFRKVVRFVANPATDWSEVVSRQDAGQELKDKYINPTKSGIL